ncbi:MAG: FAD-binding oxidoreductase [Candidatus Micrarchaeota archaeon]|nr:FAD-binding oxidoreductase [Candidatus Micrarchaeota archaeon]
MEFEAYVIRQIINESEDVRTFKLSAHDGRVPKYQPGHFFLLRLKGEDGKPVQRPYSAASHPSESLLSFCIKLKGTFTHLLWQKKEGDDVEVSGPYGTFLLSPSDAERVFIGGGVGISALRSHIIQTIKEGKPAFLFHSAKKPEGLIYAQEMRQLAQENENFRFFPSLTGEAVPPDWSGLRGRIGVAILKEKLGTLLGKTFYLCGSKEMAGELSEALMAAGVPKERIKKDEWG